MEDNKPAAYEIRDETGRKVDLVHPDSLLRAISEQSNRGRTQVPALAPGPLSPPTRAKRAIGGR